MQHVSEDIHSAQRRQSSDILRYATLTSTRVGRKKSFLSTVSALSTRSTATQSFFTLELFEHETLGSGNPVPLAAYAASSVQTSMIGRTPKKRTHSLAGKLGMRATSQMLGRGCDNPADPDALTSITCDPSGITVDQTGRCFMVELCSASEFSIGFWVLSDQPLGYVHAFGRNFALAGKSTFFADEDSHACTPAPTPSPTPASTPSATPAPTVPPTPGADGSSGDPHLVHVHGQRCDVVRPGTHVLLHVPWQEADRSRVLLRVEVEAQRLGDACADTYHTAVNIAGRWRWAESEAGARGLGEGRGLVLQAGGGAAAAARPGAAWMSFRRVSLKVRLHVREVPSPE
ncbi:unnamed protein product [Prorocentrum cordatum]|uniref:Beta-galactosidase n=1 Tax=Prorocentrum cordatum TaxID=2364126 RepID=A0ABN9V3W0_9DINO|nr:unnamed protein product [Polarella glacialis]